MVSIFSDRGRLAYPLTRLTVYIIGVIAGGMANDGLSDAQRAAIVSDPDGQEFHLRTFGSMAQIAKLLIYAFVLWTLKASLLYNFAIRLTVSSFSTTRTH